MITFSTLSIFDKKNLHLGKLIWVGSNFKFALLGVKFIIKGSSRSSFHFGLIRGQI